MEHLKVLVVDDEPGIRTGISRILSRHTVSFPFMDDDYQFQCREAPTGEEALEMIDREMPDIVLLDNKLPGIQGTEVLEILQKRKLDLIVAMITSYASLEVAAKATGDGAWDFIPKPFTPAELKSSIDLITKQYFLKRLTRNMKEEGKKIRYQFLSVLSHELKSPLTALEGYLRMMKDRELGNDLDGYQEILERSLKRVDGMRSLIMDLLDFTKMRLEKKEDKMERVDLRERVEMAIAAIMPMAIQRNITIRCRAGEDIRLKVDPADMDILLNNLLSNAVKYNKEEGSVEVSVERSGSAIELLVRDTGIGMSSEEVSRLFGEFVRIKNRRTRGIAGSGLGLSIVRKITDLYQGEINVESTPDVGSEFRILLPDSGR